MNYLRLTHRSVFLYITRCEKSHTHQDETIKMLNLRQKTMSLPSYKLQATSYKLQATSYKLQATSYKLQTTSHKPKWLTVALNWLVIVASVACMAPANAVPFFQQVPATHTAEYWYGPPYYLPNQQFSTAQAVCDAMLPRFYNLYNSIPSIIVTSVTSQPLAGSYHRICYYDGSYGTVYIINFKAMLYAYLSPATTTCPTTAPSYYTYNAANDMCERTINTTPCPAGQMPHPDGPNPTTGTAICMLDCSTQPNTHANMQGTACVPNDSCPVPYVTPLPTKASDQCTDSLEHHTTTGCPTLTAAMEKEKQCLSDKLSAKGITMNVTATVRTMAYQRHFREVWDDMDKLVIKTKKDPTLIPACAARRAELASEKGCDKAEGCVKSVGQGKSKKMVSDCPLGGHCFAARPAKPEPTAQHPIGQAIDIKGDNVTALLTALSVPPTQTMAQFLATPCATTTCTLPAPRLQWGGTFPGNPDKVHFYLP